MSTDCVTMYVYPDGFYSTRRIEGLIHLAEIELCNNGLISRVVVNGQDFSKELAKLSSCCKEIQSLNQWNNKDKAIVVKSPEDVGDVLARLLAKYDSDVLLLCLTLCASHHRTKEESILGEGLYEVLLRND